MRCIVAYDDGIYIGVAVHKHISTVWLLLRANKAVGKVGEGWVIGKRVQRP
jgi:hypothetical protein